MLALHFRLRFSFLSGGEKGDIGGVGFGSTPFKHLSVHVIVKGKQIYISAQGHGQLCFLRFGKMGKGKRKGNLFFFSFFFLCSKFLLHTQWTAT